MVTRYSKGASNWERPFNAYVGARLRVRRNDRGLSMERFGEKMGVTRQTVQSWEVGDAHLHVAHIAKFSEILNIEPSFFFEGMPELAGLDAESGLMSNLQLRTFARLIELWGGLTEDQRGTVRALMSSLRDANMAAGVEGEALS